jgi:hypothetical protein
MSQVYYPQARAILQVVFDGFGDTARDSPVTVIPVLPRDVTIHRNSYSQADSWELTFDAGDLPVDPAFIRSGAVEIYIFQTDGVDTRIVDRRDPLSSLDDPGTTPRDPVDTALLGARRLGQADTEEAQARANRDRFAGAARPLIAGLFDQSDLDLSEDGKWVSIQGQDYTAHLLSLQWPPQANGRARKVPIGAPLDQLLASILAEADPDGQLQLVTRGITGPLPVVGEKEARGNRRGISVDANTNYWDVMYGLALRHGFILYVDALDVVLARPRNLDADSAGRIKRMAWGTNLANLRLSRELGKEQSPTILVRGYDPVTRRVVEAEYPEGEFSRGFKVGDKPKKQAATTTTTRKSKKGKVTTTIRNRDEYQIIPAYGVTDVATLRRMAETYYQLRGRAERKIVAVTRDLRDLRESDMLSISAGDAVWIEWQEFNAELLRNPAMSQGAKIDHLIGRGFNASVAARIVESFEKLAALDRPLRFKEGTITYSTEDGVTIEMELADFIVIDGVRDPESNRASSVERARSRARGIDGKPVGWTPERERAEIARRGGRQ